MTFSLKISNYQCFGAEPQGFEELRPINVIIGKNNSGKSSLLDMVRFACEVDRTARAGERRPETLHLMAALREDLLEPFSAKVRNTAYSSDHEYARQFIGKPISWRHTFEGAVGPQQVIPPDKVLAQTWQRVPQMEGANPLRGRHYLRLGAARDVPPVPLAHVNDPGNWEENGNGTTPTVAAFLNKRSLPKEAVELALLEQLNRICGGAAFQEIDARLNEESNWEICLREEGKAVEIPLSKSGAGLKTILCVLTMMELRARLLAPAPHGEPAKDVIYAIEEFENNLHPTLQRRLLEYIRQRALETQSTVFLTTHSPVAIDFFAGDAEAQIVHVQHDGKNARVTPVKTYGEQRHILEDLGAKASDLLQANCVVWVEGPSDRIYFNRWIELWTNGELREGAHYQCMFYGGSLLTHVSADDPNHETDLVRLLKLNRNAIVIFDHDGDSAEAPIKPNVVRVQEELARNNGLAWVTAGREVENYLPAQLLTSVAGLSGEQAQSPFTNVPTALEDDRPGDYARAYRNKGRKVWLASDMRDRLTRELLTGHSDLAERLDEIVRYIQRANMMEGA